MDEKKDMIQHSHLSIRGLTLHVAHIGKDEKGVVVLLHGFPEIWYSWRHQMLALSDAGFLAIAPDFRGYGLSQQPSDPDKASWTDLVNDLIGILDHLAVPKAFFVGKDFGAITAYHVAVLHPERISGVVTLGVPFLHRPVPFDLLPKGFYMLRWREPGRAEKDFGRFDIKTAVRNIYILFSGSELPVAGEDQEIMDLVVPTTPLPSWFSEEDLQAYAKLYENNGFRFPLQLPYRTFNEVVSMTSDPKVLAPALLIMGEKDYVLRFPAMEDNIKSGKVKESVPNLEVTFVPEGSHFVQEQFPEEINKLILTFLSKHT